ncbi:MAG: hypothetical protein HY296_02245 [Thaumarchaeota archaeon]|nr:hypothetical protein [Nitrososphaerota archaeon]
MDLKPSKGLKVKVKASREAIFGDDGVSVSRVRSGDGQGNGVMTGMILAGFAEVEMPSLDGKRHWYPLGDMSGEHGEQIVEEEIEVGEEEGEIAE